MNLRVGLCWLGRVLVGDLRCRRGTEFVSIQRSENANSCSRKQDNGPTLDDNIFFAKNSCCAVQYPTWKDHLNPLIKDQRLKLLLFTYLKFNQIAQPPKCDDCHAVGERSKGKYPCSWPIGMHVSCPVPEAASNRHCDVRHLPHQLIQCTHVLPGLKECQLLLPLLPLYLFKLEGVFLLLRELFQFLLMLSHDLIFEVALAHHFTRRNLLYLSWWHITYVCL